MQNFIFKLRVLMELIVSVIIGYVAITYSFSTLLPNVVLGIIALSIFAETLGKIDKINGFNQEQNNDEESPSAGIPDNPQENAGFPVNQNQEQDDNDTGNPEITFILDNPPDNDYFPEDDTL